MQYKNYFLILTSNATDMKSVLKLCQTPSNLQLSRYGQVGGWRFIWFSMRNFVFSSYLSRSKCRLQPDGRIITGTSGLNDGRLDHKQPEAAQVSIPAFKQLSASLCFIIPEVLDCCTVTHTVIYYAEVHRQVCTKVFVGSLVIKVQTPHLTCCHSSVLLLSC